MSLSWEGLGGKQEGSCQPGVCLQQGRMAELHFTESTQLGLGLLTAERGLGSWVLLRGEMEQSGFLWGLGFKSGGVQCRECVNLQQPPL